MIQKNLIRSSNLCRSVIEDIGMVARLIVAYSSREKRVLEKK
jgi:hypothetical protein